MKNDLAATGTMDSDYTGIGSTTRYDSLTTSTGKSLLQYLLDEFGEQMYILDGGKKRAYTLWNSTVAAELKITYTSDYYYYMAAADQSRYNVADYQAALDALNDFLVHAHYNYAFNTYNENRYDEDKGITVEQVAAVGDNHILADYILPVINAVLVIDFLHPKRNENRKAFRSKGAQGVNLSHTKRQHRIQSVHLLIFQYGKLTQVLSGSREQRFCVAVKLLLAVSRILSMLSHIR